MVVAALDGVDGLEASRIELERDGPTYTIDTVEQLDAPERELFLVVGSDVAAGMSTWHRVDDLRDRVTLAIVDREPTPFPDPAGWRVARVSRAAARAVVDRPPRSRRGRRADRLPRSGGRGPHPARARPLPGLMASERRSAGAGAGTAERRSVSSLLAALARIGRRAPRARIAARSRLPERRPRRRPRARPISRRPDRPAVPDWWQ